MVYTIFLNPELVEGKGDELIDFNKISSKKAAFRPLGANQLNVYNDLYGFFVFGVNTKNGLESTSALFTLKF